MNVVVDTSVLVAVITSELEKQKLIKRTRGLGLLAPASVHWEVGNALAAMLKRNRITVGQIQVAVEAYDQIPVRFLDTDLGTSLDVAAKNDLYAYDAYVINCAKENHCSLISLDSALCKAALNEKVNVLEVS